MRKTPILCLIICLMAVSCQKDGNVPTFVVQDYQSQFETNYTSAVLQTTIDPSYLSYRHHFIYSLNPSMEQTNSVELTFSNGSSTTSRITGLQAGSTYYYRYMTEGPVNSHLSQTGTFSTLAYTVPSVETYAATLITANAFVANARVLADGGLTVTERGYCYATHTSPALSDHKVVSPVSGKGAYSCLIDQLAASTTYFVCAYAINEQGVAYSSTIQVTTLAQ